MVIHMEIEIIPAEGAHVPEIVELWKEAMDFYEALNPLLARSEDGHIHMEKHLHDMIQSEDTQVLAALHKGRVVGYTIFRIYTRPPILQYRTSGFIVDMAVKSDYRRKGIGGKMLHTILKWFESHNVDRIELRAAPENEVAFSFWKKHGFQIYMYDMHLLRTYNEKSK